jgi:hypothetical protein
MGAKSNEALEIAFEDLPTYLHANHSVYMDVDGQSYYLTDVNDQYWRVQNCAELNEKGHYVDCSLLVPTIAEFVEVPFKDEKSVKDLFDESVFYASLK